MATPLSDKYSRPAASGAFHWRIRPGPVWRAGCVAAPVQNIDRPPLLREADARQGVGRGVWLQRVFPTGCRRRDVLRRSLQPGADIGVAASRCQVETIWEMNISGGRHALRRLFCRWLPIHRQWLSITLPTPSSVVANKGATDRRRLEACWSAVLGVPQHRTPRRPALPRPLDQAA